MIGISFLIVVLLFVIGRYYVKRRSLVKAVDKYPGPSGLPILGSALDFIGSGPVVVKRMIECYAKKYKSPFRVWVLNVPFIVIGKPDDIQIVASKNLEKDSGYQYLADLIGDGLITCSVAKWKRRRRIVSPAFSMPNLVKNFLDVFNQHSEILVQNLQMDCKAGNQIDVWPYIVTNSFSSICETALGYNGSLQKRTSMKEYSTIHQKAAALVGKRVYQPWLYPSLAFRLYKYFTGNSNIIKEAQALPRQILQKQKIQKHENYHTEDAMVKNLVDTLTAANENNEYFNEAETTDEILTIIFAGSETTAITSSFNLLFLARNQDIQDKVCVEMQEIFGDDNRLPTPEDLQKMTFLEQCIKETLRWSSMIPAIIRNSDEDIQLTDGYVIPSGAKIVLASFLAHHDETVYPNPYSWNPDNFKAEKIANRHFCSFMPFGVGLRMCLGSRYAMMLMKVSVSAILRKYKLTTTLREEEIEFDLDFMIRKKGEYLIKFDPRLPHHQQNSTL